VGLRWERRDVRKKLKYKILILVLRWVRRQMQFGCDDDLLLWDAIRDWQFINDPKSETYDRNIGPVFVNECRIQRQNWLAT